MVKVIGTWERGWDYPLQEYERWIHPLREFGVQEFYMFPVSGIMGKEVKEYRYITDILELPELENFTRVFVDENSDTSLEDFQHPENAVYIFGRVGYSPLIVKEPGDKSIVIPSQRNAGGFWSHQTMCMVLYDRFIKEQNR